MTVENVISQPTLQSIDTKNKVGSKEIGISNQKLELKQSNEQPSKEELEKAVKSINDFIKPSNTHIQFKLHEKLNEYYVTVVDDITKEVVREIPSKKILDVYAEMTEFIGLIVDKKA
jgi:flagellar protein FlaG